MEGLLHPVGPEDVRTYWIRRGAALSVLMVVFASVGLMISNIGAAGGNAVVPEETLIPAAATEPAVVPSAEGPGPTPAGEGVPAEVANEEAVPIPTRVTAQEDELLPPEPANTFHLTEAPEAATAG